MKQNELILILQAQLREADLTIASLNERIGQLVSTISELNDSLSLKEAQLSELIARLSSLEKSLFDKSAELVRQKRVERSLKSMLDKHSEKAVSVKSIDNSEEAAKTGKVYNPKSRGNNGARRKEHFECEEEIITVEPQDVTAEDLEKARRIGVREVVRYSMVPMRFKKTVYRLLRYSLEGKVLEGVAPKSPINKSNFDGTFIAGLSQLRYMYSMPVERIVRMFTENGFDISAQTANGLLSKSARVFDNLYKALKDAVKSDPYLGCDETFSKVRVSEENISGKKIKKGYMWDAIAHNHGLVYFFYDEGSRSEQVFRDFIAGYQGAIQSDGFGIYRKVGRDEDSYAGILRLPCLQHIKRKFLDLEGDADADSVLSLFRLLYHREHEHQVGKDGWTINDNLKWRQRYAPPILRKLKKQLMRISKRKDLAPDSDLSRAVTYALNEWEDIGNIFSAGNYKLDNNTIERYNRFISLSRKNSMFFGSHKGAERGAIFYSLACSCHMHGINFFEYVADVLNRASSIVPTAPSAEYRDLLPDKWAKLQTSNN